MEDFKNLEITEW